MAAAFAVRAKGVCNISPPPHGCSRGGCRRCVEPNSARIDTRWHGPPLLWDGQRPMGCVRGLVFADAVCALVGGDAWLSGLSRARVLQAPARASPRSVSRPLDDAQGLYQALVVCHVAVVYGFRVCKTERDGRAMNKRGVARSRTVSNLLFVYDVPLAASDLSWSRNRRRHRRHLLSCTLPKERKRNAKRGEMQRPSYRDPRATKADAEITTQARPVSA